MANMPSQVLDFKPQALNIVDPRGDLTLVVGENETSFRVCSRTLARSSPVWQAMFYGPFAEGKDQQQDLHDWTVALPDDDPDAMHLILLFIHNRWDALPTDKDKTSLAHHTFFHVTITADKYDMIPALKPVWTYWPKRVRRLDFVSSPMTLLEDTWISWKLGDGESFELDMMRILDGAEILLDGQLSPGDWGRDSPPLTTETNGLNFGPWDIFGQLKTARRAVIKLYCKHITESMDSLISDSNCRQREEECDCAILGALYRALAFRSLEHWFLSRAGNLEESIHISIGEMYDLMEDIRGECKEMAKGSRANGWDTSHGRCRPWDPVDDINRKSVPELLNLVLSQREHLKKQAAASGLDPKLPYFGKGSRPPVYSF